jgi:Flp pilus assembly protein protease CpaA
MLFPLVALLIWAAVEDLRRRRVPNWLTFSLVLSGLVLGALSVGAGSLWNAFLGLLAGFALTLVLHMLGALGAGDVKLMAGAGAWLGYPAAMVVLAGAAIVGMIAAIVQTARQGRLRAYLRDSLLLVMHLLDGFRSGAITPATAAAAEVKTLSGATNDPVAHKKLKRLTLPFALSLATSTAVLAIVSLMTGFGKWVMVP